MILAEIKDGSVTNIIRVDPQNRPDFTLEYPEAEGATVGDTWDGTKFDSTKRVSEAVRNKRDMLLITEVDPVAGNALRWAALTADQQQVLADYRQALLDVPQQAGFPNDITWPNEVGGS